MESIIIQIVGIVVLMTGFYCRYRLKRRKYYRRTQPIQRISYERKVFSNIGEETLQFFSYLFIAGGILILSFGWFARHELAKEKEACYKQHPISR